MKELSELNLPDDVRYAESHEWARTEGDKVKVTLRYRGREMAHQELGRDLLKRVEADLEEYGSVEQFPRMEGRQMVMVLAPKKK